MKEDLEGAVLTRTSLRNRVTGIMLLVRKPFIFIMNASFPKRILLARFWIILVIRTNPRCMAGLSGGNSMSTEPGETIAGQMNLGKQL